MTIKAPKCPSCGFAIFNRRFPKCERCGAELPQGVIYSREEVVALQAREKAEELAARAKESRTSTGDYDIGGVDFSGGGDSSDGGCSSGGGGWD